MAALCTAALTIIAPLEPTGEPGGRQVGVAELEPHLCKSMPRPSAATWVITVDIPVPNSCVAVCMMAVPSEYRRARARWVCMKNATGYPAVAIPVPISQFPSRSERGCGLRPAQPNRCGPALVAFPQPVAGPRVAGIGINIGDVAAAAARSGRSRARLASSSIAHSRVNTPSASPGPRVNVGVIVLPRTRRCTPSKLGQAYSWEATPKAGSAQSSNGEVTEIL